MPRFELTEEQVNELANLLQNEIDYINDTADDPNDADYIQAHHAKGVYEDILAILDSE